MLITPYFAARRQHADRRLPSSVDLGYSPLALIPTALEAPGLELYDGATPKQRRMLTVVLRNLTLIDQGNKRLAPATGNRISRWAESNTGGNPEAFLNPVMNWIDLMARVPRPIEKARTFCRRKLYVPG